MCLPSSEEAVWEQSTREKTSGWRMGRPEISVKHRKPLFVSQGRERERFWEKIWFRKKEKHLFFSRKHLLKSFDSCSLKKSLILIRLVLSIIHTIQALYIYACIVCGGHMNNNTYNTSIIYINLVQYTGYSLHHTHWFDVAADVIQLQDGLYFFDSGTSGNTVSLPLHCLVKEVIA